MYLAEGEPKGSQIFVRYVDAEGPATQITHITETPRNARWSPDGKSIAFSMFVPDAEKWTISMPAEPKGAKWTPAPRVVEHDSLPAGSASAISKTATRICSSCRPTAGPRAS